MLDKAADIHTGGHWRNHNNTLASICIIIIIIIIHMKEEMYKIDLLVGFERWIQNSVQQLVPCFPSNSL